MPQRAQAGFVIVSRLEGQKRLQHAIEAFALVVAKRPEATLRIYGNGKQRARLQGAIDELGVADRVRLMGYDRHAKHELLRATGFLMTSVNEGYPLATLESMAFGCPSSATTSSTARATRSPTGWTASSCRRATSRRWPSGACR